MTNKLGKQEWMNAGLRALSNQGVDAVRIERLAKELNVTKGSFYWHFKNRTALLEDILVVWKARATNDVIAQVELIGGDARARIRSLFTIVLESDGQLDLAIRAWAINDPLAQTALVEIDKRRLAYLEALFVELKLPAIDAAARAQFAYNALIGQFVMGGGAAFAKSRRSRQFELIFEMLVRVDP